jgi:hypothetical protein
MLKVGYKVATDELFDPGLSLKEAASIQVCKLTLGYFRLGNAHVVPEHFRI